MIHTKPAIQIYFGTSSDQLYQDEYLKLAGSAALLDEPSFAHMRPLMGISNLIFLHQIHANHGLVVTEKNKTMSSFNVDGDFLVTQERGIGLGVMTADCFPILLHDPRNQAIGVVHAGWRGTVDLIVVQALQTMHREYNTDFADLHVYFGPAALVCCYEVTADFLTHLAPFPFANKLIQERSGKLFFDAMVCNRLQLEAVGVAAGHIDTHSSHCTIESDSFFSHRRAPHRSGRQMSIIALR